MKRSVNYLFEKKRFAATILNYRFTSVRIFTKVYLLAQIGY